MSGNNPIYKVKANEFEFTFTDDEIASIDLIKKSETEFNLLKGHRSVNANSLAFTRKDLLPFAIFSKYFFER